MLFVIVVVIIIVVIVVLVVVVVVIGVVIIVVVVVIGVIIVVGPRTVAPANVGLLNGQVPFCALTCVLLEQWHRHCP